MKKKKAWAQNVFLSIEGQKWAWWLYLLKLAKVSIGLGKLLLIQSATEIPPTF